MSGIMIEEGPQPRIFTLIKFICSRWVEAFRAGRLRMGSVAGFRREYEKDLGGRQDPKENLASVYQPGQIIVTFGGVQIGDITGPVEIRREIDEISYLLCMTAITDRNLNAALGSLQLDHRVGGLGDKAVIVTNVAEFQKRLTAAIISRGDLGSYPGQGNRASGIVDYVDLSTHHGDMGPFRKSVAFAFQHEWRLVLLDRLERGLREIFLEVGDLSDITVVQDSATLLASKAVAQPEPGAEPIEPTSR